MYQVKIFSDQNDKEGTLIHSSKNDSLKIKSDSLKPAINDIGSFEFTIYPNSPAWGKIHPLKTLINVYDTNHNFTVFEGRVLAPVGTMTSEGELSETYLCEDVKGFLHDSVQSFKKFTGTRTAEQLFREALKVHNSQVEEYKRFEVGTIEMQDLTEHVRFIDETQSTFQTITDKLLGNDNVGGELRVRYSGGKRYLDWLKENGLHSKTDIRIAKNLIEMSKEIDPTEIITCLYPRGATLDDEGNQDQAKPRLTISNVNGGKEYLLASQQLINEFGYQGGSQVWDDVTSAQTLKTKGQDWLNNQLTATGKYTVKAVDLSLLGIDPQMFWIGNYHRVINPLMLTDEELRIVDMNIRINEPEQTELSFGNTTLTFSQYQKLMNKRTKQLEELRVEISSQSKVINTIQNNLVVTEKSLSELSEKVSINGTQVQNQISSIISNLKDIITEVRAIDAKVPTAETMTHIDNKLTDFDRFQTDQLEINIGFTSGIADLINRVTALENADNGGDS